MESSRYKNDIMQPLPFFVILPHFRGCPPFLLLNFRYFYRTQVILGSDLWVRVSLTHSLSPRGFADLTEVTLADEDTNSIPTDNVKRVIQGNVAMQVTQPGGHLLAKFATNASGAIWWPNLQPMQVVPSGGQICNQCKWCHQVAKFRTNASGVMWWPNLELMQVAPSGDQICN